MFLMMLGYILQITGRRVERLAIGFVLGITSITYFYGMHVVLPEVLATSSYTLQLFSQALTTWIYIAVLANMYLVRKRNSSVRNRLLPSPELKSKSYNTPEYQLGETVKNLGECFRSNPFDEASNWRICAACQVFVPPRSWHCYACHTCTLRRDHHCIFTGCCIGEENHSNFLSLLFYLGCGSSVAAVFTFIHCIYVQEMSVWWYMFRLVFVIYTLFWDFQMTLILAFVNIIGLMVSWGVFRFYLCLALKAQTSADAHKKVEWTLPDQRRYSLENMSEFLGPNPILRILWPFHSSLQIDYNELITEEERHRFMTPYIRQKPSIPDPQYQLLNQLQYQIPAYSPCYQSELNLY